jgi:hypothetical protein
MAVSEWIEAEFEKGFSKFPIHMLGVMAAVLLACAGFLTTISDDANSAFWHTLNTAQGLRHFWPQGALVALIALFMSIFSLLVQLMGIATSSAFVFRILKRKSRRRAHRKK